MTQIGCPRNLVVTESSGFFYFRTSELPSEFALNSAEFHGNPKGGISPNTALFQVQNSEFLRLPRGRLTWSCASSRRRQRITLESLRLNLRLKRLILELQRLTMKPRYFTLEIWRLTLEVWKVILQPWRPSWSHGGLSGAMKAHSGAIEAHPVAIETRPVAIQAPPGATDAQQQQCGLP